MMMGRLGELACSDAFLSWDLRPVARDATTADSRNPRRVIDIIAPTRGGKKNITCVGADTFVRSDRTCAASTRTRVSALHDLHPNDAWMVFSRVERVNGFSSSGMPLFTAVSVQRAAVEKAVRPCHRGACRAPSCLQAP